jgi:protein arginine N-methyltransferase 1
LDYSTIQQPNVDASLTWTVEQAGTAHGLLIWFDAELVDGIGFSNAPGQPELIYGQAFFPLETPVDLEVGDRIDIALQAKLIDGEYIWCWNTQVSPQYVSKPLKAAFKQSTFKSMPLSLDRLHKHSKSFKPHLDLEGQIDTFVLNAMNGQCTNGEIASQLMERFPSRFPLERDALSRVGELSVKYSIKPA